VATWAALSGSSTIMVSKNVAEILHDHVTFELEAIDRMYLNAYVPSLQTGAGFVYFVKTQLGVRVPSTVMIAPMTERFVTAIERFVETEQIDLVTFEKGQRKDDIAQQYLLTLGLGIRVFPRFQRLSPFDDLHRTHPGASISKDPNDPSVSAAF